MQEKVIDHIEDTAEEIGNNINSVLGIFSKKNCLFIISKAQFFNHIKINHKRN